MNNTINKLNNLSYSNKGASGYYKQQLQQERREIRDRILDKMYDSLCQQSGHTLDLHGVNREFLDYHLIEFVDYKLNQYDEILVITGRGSGIVNRKSKKILLDNNYKIKEKDISSFYVTY